MAMKIILTGATGYVGEGVLLELLRSPEVDKVLSVSRKPTGILNGEYPSLKADEVAKLDEYLVDDFMRLQAGDEHFVGYDAVFFIAGITSVGASDDVYVRISQEIPLHFADIMPNKEKMTFIYLSGAGTDVNGKLFWQQVKGKTEQEILKKGFRRAFAYRPAFMKWACGQKRIQAMQYLFVLFYPLMRLFGQSNTMREVANSMIACSRYGYERFNVEGKDIRLLAKKMG